MPDAADKKTSVCYVLAYRDPTYIRTKSILSALERNEHVELTSVINVSRGPLRYIETLAKLFLQKKRRQHDVFILGFRGHEIYWPVRWIVGKTPLIFDSMMSPYAALSEESKHGRLGQLIAAPLKPLESAALRNSDAVLTDTGLHADYFSSTFGVDRRKIFNIPVGATEPTVAPKPQERSDRFTVLFYGSFLPLHGVDVILSAAEILKDLPIRFDFIGGNRKQIKHLRTTCERLGIKSYTHTQWAPYDKLISEVIPSASICLGGPFGGTKQAKRVITGKASQGLALGKATIIGNIEEDHGLVDKHNCLLVEQNDAKSLAESIAWSYRNQERLPKIGELGQEVYAQRLSISSISSALRAPLTFAERKRTKESELHHD